MTKPGMMKLMPPFLDAGLVQRVRTRKRAVMFRRSAIISENNPAPNNPTVSFSIQLDTRIAH
jgi:hypothetical protein